MNYYKHYIGDFQRDTGHLSLTERGAYLALIHHYYATELPLPNSVDALCRIAGAMTKPERDAVKSVMRFFQAVDSGLMHKRIEAELEKHDDRADKNRAIALAREAKRREQKQSTNRAPDVHESSTNDSPIPITNNQEPVLKALSGSPDVGVQKEKNSEAREAAKRVLSFLNEKTGRAFRPVDANVKPIVARLNSGATEGQCRQIIAKKTREWMPNPAMVAYLRPATLFNATKFEQYLGELV